MIKNKKAFTFSTAITLLLFMFFVGFYAYDFFNSMQSDIRDNQRIADLQMLKESLSKYYKQYGTYPQPSKFDEDNLWGVKSGKEATATCRMFADPVSGDVDPNIIASNSCGGELLIKKRKVKDLECILKYNFDEETSAFATSKQLEGLYEGDDFDAICSYHANCLVDEACENFNKYIVGAVDFSVGTVRYNSQKIRSTVIGWKGVINKKSGGIEAPGQDLFGDFIDNEIYDPKFSEKGYRALGLGDYIYAVYYDKSMQKITKYQIAATLENKDEDGMLNPETLIIGNYRAKKGMPISLIGNASRVVVNGQKVGVKMKDVARPDMDRNWGIPYEIEDVGGMF